MSRFTLVSIALLGIPTVTLAQNPVALTRLTGPVELDGRIDESAWNDVAPLEMTLYTPVFQGTPTELSDIRIGYDDAYIYVAARMYDSDPAGIRANTFYRDQYSGDDLIGVVLDTYNDHETAVSFLVNPAGTRLDRAILNDAEATGVGFPMNSDWNTFWDVTTSQDDEGWYAEMRIPFSSLGFQDIDGQVEMGLIVYRLIARKWERHIYPAVPPNWEIGFMKPSQAQRVTLQDVHATKPKYLIPYALAGVDRVTVPSTPTGYAVAEDVVGEVGVDFKYSPTSNLALDLTVNTDFAQVEADDQQLNLTRFSLFFPEKRQFFQERASTFDFNMGGVSRLFHSRQIGLDDGRIVRIYGGGRGVGRIGGLDYGFLNMQTADSPNLPSENFGVLRVSQKVLNPFSAVGLMGTSRLGTDGNYNFGFGFDAVIRPFGDEYVTFKWAETWDKSDPTGRSVFDGARIVGQWERRNLDGFSYLFNYTRSGSTYLPRLGFVVREDFQLFRNSLAYLWFANPTSYLRTFAVNNDVAVFVRNADGLTESANITPGVSLESKSGHQMSLSFANIYEGVLDTFQISGGTPVLPGEYWFHEAVLDFEASRGGKIRPSFTASGGSFYDGWRVGTTLRPAWNPNKHLELSLDYSFNAIRFPDRNESIDQHLVRLRAQAALNVHLSLSAFVQYNNTEDIFAINARLRYHFREGQDLWLVYDEGLNTERGTDPSFQLPLSDRRALRIKYTHTFTW